jgi:HEAT repeat protein
MDTNSPPPDDAELPALLDDLVTRAQSASADDRLAAVEGLYELAFKTGPKIAGAIPALIDRLLDSNPKVGESAGWALVYCRPNSIEPLVECLEHPSSEVRERAAQALGNIGDEAKSASLALRTLLGDEDQAVRVRAAWALGLVHDTHPDAIQMLIRKVSHGTSKDMAAALHALGNIGRELDEPALLQAHQSLILAALQHPSADVRFSALYAMESLGLASDEQAELLAGMVHRGQSDRVLDGALMQLKRLAPVVDLRSLVSELTQLVSGGRRHGTLACEILSSVRPATPETTEALLRALAVDELVVPAARALWRLTGRVEPLLPALERIFDDYDESVCDLICDLGPAAAPLLPKLIDALAEENWDLQWAAADALGAVASSEPHAVDLLIDALRHQSPIVRSASARALAKIGEAVVPLLRNLVVDEPNERGPWAAFALGEMGAHAAAALPTLRAGMRGGVEPMAGCCAIAVALVGGDTEAVSQLEAILQSDDPRAPRRGAASALGRLGPAAKGSIALLETLLGDEDFDVHQAAEEALAAIHGVTH